jgi:hypothetical protein
MKAVFFFALMGWMISSCSSSKIASSEADWDDTYVRSSREKKDDSSSSRVNKTIVSNQSTPQPRERLTTFYGPFMPGYAPFSPFGYNPYGYYSDPFGYTVGSPMFYGSYYDPYRYNPWGPPVGRVPSGNTPFPTRPSRPSSPPINTQNWNNTNGSRPGSGSRGGWNSGSGGGGNSGFNSGNSFNNKNSNFNSGGSGGFSNPPSGGSARPSTGGRGGR